MAVAIEAHTNEYVYTYTCNHDTPHVWQYDLNMSWWTLIIPPQNLPNRHQAVSLLMNLVILSIFKPVISNVISLFFLTCLFSAFLLPWWRHQIETFSALLAICAGNSPACGEFPAQRPVTRSYDVFFDLRLNKRLSKQSWGWWFETLSRPLWRHRNDIDTVWCNKAS